MLPDCPCAAPRSFPNLEPEELDRIAILLGPRDNELLFGAGENLAAGSHAQF